MYQIDNCENEIKKRENKSSILNMLKKAKIIKKTSLLLQIIIIEKIKIKIYILIKSDRKYFIM